MVKMICFDMDGTIADLYEVRGWLNCLEVENPAPYRAAKPMWNMPRLTKILRELIAQGWNVRVISWLSKDSSEDFKTAVRTAKREWLDRYNFPAENIHLVRYGATKADSVRGLADYAILVDDNEKVRNGWHLGDTIDPGRTNLLKELKKLLDKE